ncbi:unnamed protein product [Paramecium sonneborni]|uniref:Protein kinase domain-containing protein n=1 Tax=Paramecium sonneborni TaxID=65129 RepID=A0A8S1RBW5_9CILI|nr:unnamed protein product [Paramecium sonneborni]
MFFNTNIRTQNAKIIIDGVTYLKLEQLGQGMEGVIYKGENIQTKEIVAIKEYSTININEQKAFQVIQSKCYNHIIEIKGLKYNQNQCPIIVMEFANGEFYNFMKSNEYSRLDYQQKNQYFLQMAKGVSQLHQLGLFHRDLKPENFVYINKPNQQKIIKLIDFGLVKETANKLGKTGCVGTPYYIAPEVIQCNQNRVAFYDKSVDIWSLGSIWFELLVGETFFNGTQQEIFNRIQIISQFEIDKQIQQNPIIQQKEKDLIKKMMKKIPTQRLQLEKIIEAYDQYKNQQQNENQNHPSMNFNQTYLNNQSIEAQFKQGYGLFTQQQTQFNQGQQQFQQIFPIQQQQLNNNSFHYQPSDFQDNERQQQQDLQELKQILDRIQEETQKKMKDEYEKKLRDFELKKEEEMQQIKRQIELQKDQELLDKIEQFKNQQKNEFELQIKEKETELKKQQQEVLKQQQDNEKLAELKLQQVLNFQNEMDKFKKIKEQEQNAFLQKFKEKENQKKEEEIKQKVLEQEEQIKQQLEKEIQTKYMLDYANKVDQLQNQLQQENQQYLQNEKQSLLSLLQSQQNNMKIFNQNIQQKLEIIENINLMNDQKNKLIQQIKIELKKNDEKLLKNRQIQQQIQQVSKVEQTQGLDRQLASEIQQDILDYNNTIQMISEQQMLLQNQLGDQQKNELQEKEQLKQQELENQLNLEKKNFKLKFENLTQQSYQYNVNITKIEEKMKFYEKNLVYQISGQERLQEILRLFQKITQELVGLEQQEKIIIQIDKPLQLINYQSFTIKLEELLQAQNILKNLINDMNKIIEQIDSKFIQDCQRQIDFLADNLNDYQDKFMYLSQNQKYAEKINQYSNQLGFCSEQLNDLNQLLQQGIFLNYLKFKQIYDYITQQLQEFNKQHNLLLEQIHNDQHIEQKNNERIKKLKQIEGQLNEFIVKMNQLKISVNDFSKNQYCNNEQTRNLIADKQQKIDQNIYSIQQQYQNFLRFNNLSSYDSINFQMIDLESFKEKLKLLILDEQEKVNQLYLIIQKIGNEQKTEQEKEYFQLNNQLQILLMRFSRALSSVKIDQETIDYLKIMNEKKEKLQIELEQEIERIENYYKINKENQNLFKKLIDSQKIKSSELGNNFLRLVNKLQQYNKDKTQKLDEVYQNAHNKQNELQFNIMDNTLVDNYQELKKTEEHLFKEINEMGQKSQELQLNPSAFMIEKEKIQQQIERLNHLIKRIPSDNEINIFNKKYKSNLDSFFKLYALSNYIRQYNLTRYYERIKEDASKQKNKQNQSSYIAIFQQKKNQVMEENTKKEQEAQNLLKIYQNILFNNNNQRIYEQLQKDYDSIIKQISETENVIKSKNLVRLRGSMKNQDKIQEIIKNEYYRISELAQMQEFQIIWETI